MHLIVDKIRSLLQDKTLKNGFAFSIFAFIGKGISFVLLILLASFIPPSDYGKLSLFNTAVMLLGFFMSFSSSGYFSISFFKEEKDIFHQDFTVIQLLLLLSVVIISFFFLVWDDKLSSLIGISSGLLWWALVIAFSNVPFQMHMDYYRIQENVFYYGLLNLGSAILNALFSLLLVIQFAQGWMGRINTHIGVSLLFFIIALVFFLNKGFFVSHISKERLKIILFWGIPQIPHLATNWIRQGCDQYIINYNYSVEEVGLFSFALNLVSIITIIGMAFNSSNSVSIFQIISNKSIINKEKYLKDNTRNILYVYIFSTVIFILGVCLFLPFLLPKYTGSLPFFMVLSIYGFLVCIYFLYCNYLFYYGYTRILMYITFGTAIIHLCLSLLFTKYSLFYTTIIYVVSQTICVAFVYLCSKKILKKELSKI